jgi:hypothetical protein
VCTCDDWRLSLQHVQIALLTLLHVWYVQSQIYESDIPEGDACQMVNSLHSLSSLRLTDRLLVWHHRLDVFCESTFDCDCWSCDFDVAHHVLADSGANLPLRNFHVHWIEDARWKAKRHASIQKASLESEANKEKEVKKRFWDQENLWASWRIRRAQVQVVRGLAVSGKNRRRKSIKVMGFHYTT